MLDMRPKDKRMEDGILWNRHKESGFQHRSLDRRQKSWDMMNFAMAMDCANRGWQTAIDYRNRRIL